MADFSRSTRGLGKLLSWLFLIVLFPLGAACRPPTETGPILSECKQQLERSSPALPIDVTEGVGSFFPPGMRKSEAIRILTGEKFKLKLMSPAKSEYNERLFSSLFFKRGKRLDEYNTYECRVVIDIIDDRVAMVKSTVFDQTL